MRRISEDKKRVLLESWEEDEIFEDMFAGLTQKGN